MVPMFVVPFNIQVSWSQTITCYPAKVFAKYLSKQHMNLFSFRTEAEFWPNQIWNKCCVLKCKAISIELATQITFRVLCVSLKDIWKLYVNWLVGLLIYLFKPEIPNYSFGQLFNHRRYQFCFQTNSSSSKDQTIYLLDFQISIATIKYWKILAGFPPPHTYK